MALDLQAILGAVPGAALETALDGQTRRPRVEIVSHPKTADIPFDGNVLTTDTRAVSDPTSITHSTGRIIIASILEYDNVPDPDLYSGIKFTYTDVDRLEFFHVDIPLSTINDAFRGVSICEMDDSNIGVVLSRYWASDYYISYMIISPVGVVLTSQQTIMQSAPNAGQTFSQPWVQKIDTGNYILVYARSVMASSHTPDVKLVSGTPDTITDDSSMFVKDGFEAGQIMTLNGTSPICDGDYTIASVLAGTITLTSNTTLVSQTKLDSHNYTANGYHLVKYTSTDFTDWISVPYVINTNHELPDMLAGMGLDSTKKINNPSMIQVDNDDVWLMFDLLDALGPGGEEITNCYYSVSDDLGVTWGTPVALTDHESFGILSDHPVGVQRTTTEMDIVFTRILSSLKMKDTASGWDAYNHNYTFSFDPVTRMLYAVIGQFTFRAIVQINLDTWEVINQWDGTSSPAFPTWMVGEGYSYINLVHDGSHLVIPRVDADGDHLAVHYFDGSGGAPDYTSPVITSYYFTDQEPSTSKNINTDSIPRLDYFGDTWYNIRAAHVVKSQDRIYVLLGHEILGVVSFGYIDLTETVGISTCSFHAIITEYEGFDTYEMEALNDDSSGGMYIDITNDYVVFSGGYDAIQRGFCALFDLSTGSHIESYRNTLHVPYPDSSDPKYSSPGRDDFPLRGIARPIIHDNGSGPKIYAAMRHYDVIQPDIRGLVEIDIRESTIAYYRPTYCSDNDHPLHRPLNYKDDKLLFTHGDGQAWVTTDGDYYGVVAFDTISKTWERWSNDTLPGLTDNDTDVGLELPVLYDPINEFIITGQDENGVIAFSEHGYIKQSYYFHGDLIAGAWVFNTTPVPLVQGYKHYDAGVCKEPALPYIYAFWQVGDTADDPTYTVGQDDAYLMWDKDGSFVDITTYITNREISLKRSISGIPAEISFTLSHGHLFDWNNISSLLSPLLKKGRQLKVRWGEDIGGVMYWIKASEFYVHSVNIEYKKGTYPTITISAADQRILWQFSHITATTEYTSTPDVVLSNVLQTWAGMSSGEINFNTLEGSIQIFKQWIDSTLGTIIDQITNRFSQFFRFDIDGVAEMRYVSNANAVSHVYSDATKITDFSPDDKYSDFTNKISVEGLERSLTTVILPEERIDLLSGTLGWWGQEKDHIVWYSDDKTRKCIYPRMNVIDTSKSIASYFALGNQTTETLTIPPLSADYKYCTVEIEAANLTPALIAAIIGAIAGALLSDGIPPGQAVQVNTVTGTGVTVSPWSTFSIGKIIQQISITIALLILASETVYQIEVYAQPLGKVRRKVYGEWEDVPHQLEIGATIPQKIEDDFCYSGNDCEFLAEHEGDIIQMQRNRVTFSKLADLRDEEGDTISIIHPYGRQIMKIFIVDLDRKFKKADGSDEQGYFMDYITGWVIV